MSPQPKEKQYSVSKDVTDFFKLTHCPLFAEGVNKIRSKHTLATHDLQNPFTSSSKSAEQRRKRLSKMLEMAEDILRTLKKFNLTDKWFSAVFDFVVFDNRLVIDDFEFRGFSIDVVDEERIISLRLNKDATLKEIKANWPKIQEQLNKLPGKKKTSRNKPSKNFMRDYKIFLMHQLKFSSKEIARKISAEYTGTILVEAEINSIVSRFQKMVGKNHSK